MNLINTKNIIMFCICFSILFIVYTHLTTYTIANKQTAVTSINEHYDNTVDIAETTNMPDTVTKKRVQFNEQLNIIPYNKQETTNYADNINTIIKTDDLDNLIDDLIKKPVAKQNNVDIEYIHKTNQNDMFTDMENELNKHYDSVFGSSFKDIERPQMPNLIPNSETATNSSHNPVINPNCYNLNETNNNKTLWDTYDDMTTNNYKQYSTNNIAPNANDRTDNYLFTKSNEYGSQFDNFGSI